MTQETISTNDPLARKAKNISILAAVIIVFAAVGWIFFVRPIFDDLKTTDDQLNQQQIVLNKKEQESTELEKKKSTLAGSLLSQERILESIPEGMQQSSLIRDLANLTAHHNFTLGSMSFSPSKGKMSLNKVSIPVSLTGSYEQLVDFLKSVETSPRFFDVKGISVQVVQEDGIEKVNFNLSLEAFYQ